MQSVMGAVLFLVVERNRELNHTILLLISQLYYYRSHACMSDTVSEGCCPFPCSVKERQSHNCTIDCMSVKDAVLFLVVSQTWRDFG